MKIFYEVVQTKQCDRNNHRKRIVGSLVHYTIFENINDAFRCMAEYNEEMPFTTYFKGYAHSNCECRAEVRAI